MTKAIYAGSFDPFNKDNKFVVDKASKMYEQLFVVVANNNLKENQSPLKERFENLKKIEMPSNVMVLMLPSGLITTMARQMHIDVLVRGYRTKVELAREEEMAKKNRKYQSHIKTIFINVD